MAKVSCGVSTSSTSPKEARFYLIWTEKRFKVGKTLSQQLYKNTASANTCSDEVIPIDLGDIYCKGLIIYPESTANNIIGNNSNTTRHIIVKIFPEV